MLECSLRLIRVVQASEALCAPDPIQLGRERAPTSADAAQPAHNPVKTEQASRIVG